jgi:phospholipid-transporting ATPase
MSLTFISYSIKNLLLRGCYLRNTEYCVGLVVYVGPESKIMMNAKKPPKKVSFIMQQMNYMLYTVFGFQFMLIIAYASVSLQWNTDYARKSTYLNLDSNVTGLTWFYNLLTFWVAYSHLIPISLYVIIEMLKLSQAYLIGRDVQMYDRDTEQFGLCRNSDLIEELGQIDFIFSDKTGTLTQNKMIFKKCSVGTSTYGEAASPEEAASEAAGGSETMPPSARKRIRDLIHGSQSNQGIALREFFTMLAVCHTVMVEKDPLAKKAVDESDLKYSASSPDELALVKGSKEVGITYIKRTANVITIRVGESNTGVIEDYEALVEFPFDSTRKRMSLIVKHQATGKHYLMTKGADTIMLPRIKIDIQTQQRVEADLYKFACEGLRTLVFSKKELPTRDFDDFMRKYIQVKTSIDPHKEAKLLEMFDGMERDLSYLGSSAIEDKLQDNVAETIENIMNANVRIWVLTGDKQETAIEIGKACRLIQPQMQEIILSSSSREEFVKKLREHSSIDYGTTPLAIVIDGQTLIYALSEEELSQRFFEFGIRANSVICCRVSPKQKADVVGLAKR